MFSRLKEHIGLSYGLASIVLAVVLLSFGYWVLSSQQSSLNQLNSAVLQREAVAMGLTYASAMDINQTGALQSSITTLINRIPELVEVSAYKLTTGNKFEIVASSDTNKLGLVVTDDQKLKAFQTNEIITYQKQVTSNPGPAQKVDRQIIPVIPILDSDQKVVGLLELTLSTQEAVALYDTLSRNHALFWAMAIVLSTVLTIAVITLLYLKRRATLHANANIARKDELLATAAHDLRGPLIVIRQSIQEVVQKAGQIDSTRLNKLYDDIAKATSSTLDFLEDLLMVSRFERDKEQIFPRPALLQEVIHQVMEQMAPQASAKGLSLKLTGEELETLPKMLIDPGKMNQVFTNYLSNAIKYSDHGEIVVNLETRPSRRKHYIVVGVTDQGPGISESDQKKLFKSFSRVGPTMTTHPGTGLGLYIVKQIVNAHGGNVSVRSKPGAGATFYFSLPVPTQQGLEEAEPKQTA